MSVPDVMEYASHREVRWAGNVRRGETTLVTGCMFSGKTTLLLNALAEQPVGSTLAIRHRMDDRYRTDAIVSHEGRSFPAHTIGEAQDLLRWETDRRFKLIVIDEVHFLGDSLLEAADRVARKGVDVMMAGLDLDSWGRPFPHMVRLACGVRRTVSCTGTCARCGSLAVRTQRLTPIVNGQMVGAAESYEPRCVRCWTPPPVTVPSDATKHGPGFGGITADVEREAHVDA